MSDRNDHAADPLLREDFRGFVFLLAFVSASLAALFAVAGYRGGLSGFVSLGIVSMLSVQALAGLQMWWRLRRARS